MQVARDNDAAFATQAQVKRRQTGVGVASHRILYGQCFPHCAQKQRGSHCNVNMARKPPGADAQVLPGTLTQCGTFEIGELINYGVEGIVYACTYAADNRVAAACARGSNVGSLSGVTIAHSSPASATQTAFASLPSLRSEQSLVAAGDSPHDTSDGSSTCSVTTQRTLSDATTASLASIGIDTRSRFCVDTPSGHAQKLIAKVVQPKFRVSTLRELAILQRIPKHPNVACTIVATTTVVSSSSPPASLFALIQPRYECDLFDYLESYVQVHGACLPEPLARLIFLDVMHGVAHLHSHGYIHGDIKSENVLVVLRERDDGGMDDGVGSSFSAGQASDTTYASDKTPLWLTLSQLRASLARSKRLGRGVFIRAALTDFGTIRDVHTPIVNAIGTKVFQAPENQWLTHESDSSLQPPYLCQWQQKRLLGKRAVERDPGAVKRRTCMSCAGPPLDIWAAGALLCMLTCLRYPHNFIAGAKGQTCHTAGSKIVTGTDNDPYVTMSPSLRALLQGMMHPDPSARMRVADVLASPWCANVQDGEHASAC